MERERDWISERKWDRETERERKERQVVKRETGDKKRER